MKLLVTGGKGMLGRTIVRLLGRQHEVAVADLPEVDICDQTTFQTALAEAGCEAVVHCAAMTAVDRCEEEVDLAWRVNAIGSANVAIACQRLGKRLIAISTDYVFDGCLDRPYHEWDAPCPASVYGQSKLAGEEAIRQHCPDHCILRIAWLYGAGGPSFLHTMLKLGTNASADPLRVVDDQLGSPTSCDAVCGAIETVLNSGIVGTVHASCEGETSWHGFTQAIFDTWGLQRGVDPCSTEEFPRPAPRPANSRLEKRALRLHGLTSMPDWLGALGDFRRAYPDG